MPVCVCRNAVSVNNIAMSMSSASQSVLRINFMHKCALPEFAVSSSSMPWCDTRANSLDKL
jgi:hypothetical protein